MAARAKVTSKEGPTNRSGSVTTVPHRINVPSPPRPTTQGPAGPLPSKGKRPLKPKETKGAGTRRTTNTPATRPPPAVGGTFPSFLNLEGGPSMSPLYFDESPGD